MCHVLYRRRRHCSCQAVQADCVRSDSSLPRTAKGFFTGPRNIPRGAPVVAPAVSINDLMVDWVDHAAHALWNVEEEGQVPKDEKAWKEIERHSTQLSSRQRATGTLPI